MTEAPLQPIVVEGEPDRCFVRMRFVGGRFDRHIIPLEVLPDLNAYRDLIIDVARHLFKQNNQGRQRVKKGFGDSFQIGLSKVVQGNSATALMERVDLIEDQAGAGQVVLFHEHQEFEQARDLIDRVIAAANDGVAPPEDFPAELAGRFNRFGQSLRAGEYAEISHGRSAPVRYDSDIRKFIVLSGSSTYEDKFDRKFALSGGEISTRTVHLSDEAGSLFDVRADSDAECDKAIARRRHHVRVVGIGSFDRQDSLKRILRVDQFIYTDDEPRQPFSDRLDEISEVPAGWFDGENPAPNSDAIAIMRRLVGWFTAEAGGPAPYLYPLTDGSITGEWSKGSWEISTIIRVPDFVIELYAVNTRTEREHEEEMKELDDSALKAFGEFWSKTDDDREQE